MGEAKRRKTVDAEYSQRCEQPREVGALTREEAVLLRVLRENPQLASKAGIVVNPPWLWTLRAEGTK
jgi:hypothetical protein